jgi:hypothetical protein
MAIKNTLMGGTDWTTSDIITHTDLNDTFDKLYELGVSNPCFWLNSETYDVYDDFDSHSTGAFSSTADWTVSTTTADGSSASHAIVVSNNANGGSTGKELALSATGSSSLVASATATLVAEQAVNNRHCHLRIAGVLNYRHTANNTLAVTIDGGSTWYNYYSQSGGIDAATTTTTYTDFLVIALGGDEYDVYVGGRKLASAASVATLKPGVRIVRSSNGGSSPGTSYLYVDDAVQSKVSTS